MRPPTSVLVSAGLVGGYATARFSGNRQLGGLVLGAAGAASAVSWSKGVGPARAAGLLALYVGAFGGSHPLAKKIGAWPSVGVVTAGTAAAAHCLGDRPARRA
ncbi:hypothetical protein [Nocardioides bruguierae]|uniref:Uncharacterized protein n=1 Tax=Nocardioides bruguierae TaxID=2945102 RepID=A0A9X2D5B0_9ACTN|nr:hypothetical protein [Nocardioides bruguierae]MCL8025971.1 hypothetical protein [Nocardioides bruguierae]MCM0619097.1 hypothetical protein [Nocardioides bruguierae]